MDPFYTIEDIARLLKVSKMTVYRYIKADKIPAYKFGKELRIKPKDFEMFLNKSKVQGGN